MPKLITVGQLIDHTWEHYRSRFAELMNASAWLIVPAILSIVALSFYPSATKVLSTQPFTMWETAAVVLWLVTVLVATPAFGLWIFTSLIRLVNAQWDKKRVDAAEVSRASLNWFFPMLWVSFLVVLVMAGAAAMILPGILLDFLAVAIGNETLAALAGLLVIIGSVASVYFGIRWLVHYALAQYALVLDNRRGRASLTRSRLLIRGRFWPVVARLVVPKVVFGLVAYIALLALTFLVQLLLKSAVGLNIDVYLRLYSILTLTCSFAVAILVNPLAIISDYLLYRSLTEK